MEIISKVTQKAEETIQNVKNSEVTKKALSYAEIPGLQIQIGKAEAAIRKAYAAIGEAYYNSKEGDADVDFNFDEQFAIIKENKEKIESLKADIEERKKASETPQKENGEATAEKKEKEQKVCPICNHSVDAESAFCNICGHQF